ncbi:glycosyltransferase family 61 protein [Methylobacterium sp. ID0610]|uniref:glycosyltransferase family 61 protein n=1 Tax=Methylobacterium carpenticola TaxID=3344827 RepID=UPI003673EAA4
MRDDVRGLLGNIWSQSMHPGRSLRFLEFREVFVALEGLCFDASLTLIPETRTYHSDADIAQARARIEAVRSAGQVPTIERAVLAKNRGATNYGHFILEMLPRAWYARRHLDLADWPALIHRASPALDQIKRQALQAAGYAPEQVVVTGDDPVRVERLMVVDGLAVHTQYLSPFVMTCLDEIAAAVPPGDVDRLYASRGAGASRDFDDEPAVARHLATHGYSDRFAGGLSFADQIRVFRGSSRVAGVMGAALTNIAFCKPGTTVSCFMPSSACEVLFWRIAEARRLNYVEIRCREVGPQRGGLPWDRALTITPFEIDCVLRGRSAA